MPQDVVQYVHRHAYYDLVVCYGLYHCLDDAAVVLAFRRMLGCLKPNGLIAFAAFNNELCMPEDHETGPIFLRPKDHIFSLASNSLEVLSKEFGVIEDTHPPLVGRHKHSLTWALFRKT